MTDSGFSISLRQQAALADLAFGRLIASTFRSGPGPSLAMLPPEHLLLDLSDPAQREFGDYVLIELLGRGGMGVVYRAYHRSLDREVALKLLLAGPWASADFIERFRREAQSAARMQHPNIVTIHEIAQFEELNFFSMQLVRGPSLAMQLAERGPPSPREAARMLHVLAEAVDYAHRLGVLHLDLKPGNVLIDDNGKLLVADFGLARRLDDSLGHDSHEVSGTPSYMAPEQAQPGSHRLSAATDIHGLGAILYELLSGQPPFLASTAAETMRQVVHQVPQRPSLQRREIPPDLEAICLKCLMKAPDQRYASTRALADDLARYLDGRAVSVRSPFLPERLARAVRREPRLALASAIALLILMLGLGTSLWLWQRAEHNAALAREVNRFLNEDVLAAADPYRDLGGEAEQITVPTLLAAAEVRLDQGLIGQPEARAQVALTLARAYYGLGLWTQARERLEKAHVDARAMLGAEAALTLDLEQQLVLTSTLDGRYVQAEQVYRHLLEARRRQAGEDDPRTIAVKHSHAYLLYETDRFEQAMVEFESVRTAAREHAPELLAEIEWTLAELYSEVNRWDDAEALMRSVLARSSRTLGPHHPQYLWETMTLGDLQMMQARWDDADATFHNMHDGLLRSVGAAHPKTLTATHYLGLVALERGQPATALPLLQSAMQGRLRVHGDAHKYTHYSMNRVGQALTALGRPREAMVLLKRTLDLATRAGRRSQAYVLLLLDNLAQAHLALGESDRAEGYLDEAMTYARQSLPANNVRRAMLERSQGDLRIRQGRSAEARALYESAARTFAEGFGEAHPWVVDLRARVQRLRGT